MSQDKEDPLEIRAELARRFPKWTQPYWTYQMSLAPRGAQRRLRWSQKRHLVVWLVVYLGSTALAIVSIAALLQLISAAFGG